MKESVPYLVPLEPNAEPLPIESLYVVNLTPHHAKDIFSLMNKVIHDAMPENKAPDNIYNTLEERRYVTELARVTRKFAPPPRLVAQDPDASYEHNVALTAKEIKLIQTEGEKRYKSDPENNSDIESTLAELDLKFNGAETKARFGRTITR
jgi:hypothetical protein